MKNLYHLSVFPKTEVGGNLAGVYINADKLTSEEMQKIAFEVGYSETAFVMKSKVADLKVRFFTPLIEVDLCGHATIGTFNLLRDLKIISLGNYTQETKAGVLNILVKESEVFMEQLLPTFSDTIKTADLQKCFKNIHFDETLKPQILSTGIREIFIPIKNKLFVVC